MKDGQVAEHGTHAQLMARGRDYATLFTSVQQEVQCSPMLREKPPGSLTHGVLGITFFFFPKIHEAGPARLQL